MKDWEFLLQREGDRTWLPLETPTVEILEGRYRIVARTRYPNAAVDIYISFLADQGNPPRHRVQQRTRQTNSEGLMAVLPFSMFRSGHWELRCREHAEAREARWQATVQIQVLPQDALETEDVLSWMDPSPEVQAEARFEPNFEPNSVQPPEPLASESSPAPELSAEPLTTFPDRVPTFSPEFSPAFSPAHSQTVSPEPSPNEVSFEPALQGISSTSLSPASSPEAPSPPAATPTGSPSDPLDQLRQLAEQMSQLVVDSVLDFADESSVDQSSDRTGLAGTLPTHSRDLPSDPGDDDHALAALEAALAEEGVAGDGLTSDGLVSDGPVSDGPVSDGLSSSIPPEGIPASDPAVLSQHLTALQFQIAADPLQARWGEPCQISAALAAKADLGEATPSSIPEAVLVMEVRDPGSTQVVAHAQTTLAAQPLPLAVAIEVGIPRQCPAQLLLGSLTLWQRSETGYLSVLAAEQFTVLATVEELVQGAQPMASSESLTDTKTQTEAIAGRSRGASSALQDLQTQAAYYFLEQRQNSPHPHLLPSTVPPSNFPPSEAPNDERIKTDLLGLLKEGAPASESGDGSRDRFQVATGPTLPPKLEARSSPEPTSSPSRGVQLPSFGRRALVWNPVLPDPAGPATEPEVDQGSSAAEPNLTKATWDDVSGDANGLDTSGLDASGLDASGLDASGLDASGLDTSESPALAPSWDEALPEGAGDDVASPDRFGETPLVPLPPKPEPDIQSLNLGDRFQQRLNALIDPEPDLPSPLESALDPQVGIASDTWDQSSPDSDWTESETAAIAEEAEPDYSDFPVLPTEVVVDDERLPPAPQWWMGQATESPQVTPTQPIPIPELQIPDVELIAGQRIRIKVRLTSLEDPATPGRSLCVKLWLLDCQTRSLVGDPYWLSSFLPIDDTQQECILDLTIPTGCTDLQIEAIAIDLTTQQESHKTSQRRMVMPATTDIDSDLWA